MLNQLLIPGAFLASLLCAAVSAQITPGNLVVTRVGDPSGTLSNAACAVFLDEYDRVVPDQLAPLQSLAMPTTTSGANRRLTNSGTASSEGGLTQSADGRYFVLAGYDAALGTPSVASTTSAATPRVIGRVALDGTIDTSTGLTDGYTGNNIRAATSYDGAQFWTAGTASGQNGGVRYSVLGGSTSTLLSLAPTNTRRVGIFDGQLWVGTASSPFIGISQMGTGLPTTSGNITTLLNGFPPSGSNQPYDFWFADAQTLYVADDRTGVGGIQKWQLSSGTWTLSYTLSPNGDGCRGLSGIVEVVGTPTLYAVTTANKLVAVQDLGPTSSFLTLATASPNTVFRGVCFVRQPNSVTVSGTPCPTINGIPTIGTTGGRPISGNANFALTVGNLAPGSFYITIVSINQVVIPGGVPIGFLGFPACAILYTPTIDITLSSFADGAGNGVTPLSLAPADASLWGLGLPVQHLIFDPALYPTAGLPLATTEALQIEIGN